MLPAKIVVVLYVDTVSVSLYDVVLNTLLLNSEVLLSPKYSIGKSETFYL